MEIRVFGDVSNVLDFLYITFLTSLRAFLTNTAYKDRLSGLLWMLRRAF